MSMWTKLFAGSSEGAQPASFKPATKATEPKASCIYIFSSRALNSQQRQEAIWRGFFGMNTAIASSVAQSIPLHAIVIAVDPSWEADAGNARNLRHAASLADAALSDLFDDEHKDACYVDAIVAYPDRPPALVLMVWNSPSAWRARRQIPGAKPGR